MERYQNKAPSHLAPPDPTAQGIKMPTLRERRLSNCRVLCVRCGEARKWKKLGKESGKGEVKYNPVSEGYRKQTMVLQDLSEEGTTKADQEGEDQE